MMKLIHEGTGKEVQIGDEVYDSDGDRYFVEYFSEPHKPSSSGKVTTTDREGHSFTFFVQCYGLKWIEREDQGWVHPEVELAKVLSIYDEIYDKDISGFNLENIVEDVRIITMGELADYPPEYALTLKKWLNKQ